jgi:hypothetical protein
VFESNEQRSNDESLTAEQQAQLDALWERVPSFPVAMSVSMDEFLDGLAELSDEELCELDGDRAFLTWKTKLESTDDDEHISDVLAFMSAKQDVSKVERATGILRSLSRNWGLDPEFIRELMGFSATYGFGFEYDLAGGENLTDELALRLVRGKDESVHLALAHNRMVPHAALKALASMQTVDADLLENILTNPSCTPEIRRLLNPDSVALFNDLKASTLAAIASAEFGDEFWETFDVTACFIDDMVAALNPNLPYDIAGRFESRRDEVGAVARHMTDTGSYVHLQFEHDLDDDDLTDDDYDFDE